MKKTSICFDRKFYILIYDRQRVAWFGMQINCLASLVIKINLINYLAIILTARN